MRRVHSALMLAGSGYKAFSRRPRQEMSRSRPLNCRWKPVMVENTRPQFEKARLFERIVAEVGPSGASEGKTSRKRPSNPLRRRRLGPRPESLNRLERRCTSTIRKKTPIVTACLTPHAGNVSRAASRWWRAGCWPKRSRLPDDTIVFFMSNARAGKVGTWSTPTIAKPTNGGEILWPRPLRGVKLLTEPRDLIGRTRLTV